MYNYCVLVAPTIKAFQRNLWHQFLAAHVFNLDCVPRSSPDTSSNTPMKICNLELGLGVVGVVTTSVSQVVGHHTAAAETFQVVRYTIAKAANQLHSNCGFAGS